MKSSEGRERARRCEGGRESSCCSIQHSERTHIVAHRWLDHPLSISCARPTALGSMIELVVAKDGGGAILAHNKSGGGRNRFCKRQVGAAEVVDKGNRRDSMGTVTGSQKGSIGINDTGEIHRACCTLTK